MDETRIYSVDSETFNELSHANDELIQYLQWRIERNDLEAINKLSPIVRRTTGPTYPSSRGLSRKSLTLLMPLINFATKKLSRLLGPARQRRLSNSLGRSMS